MKIHVLGHARHGKDTASDIISQNLKLSWCSSSLFAAEKIVWPQMPEYESADACFRDRHNHRAKWFDLIKAYGEGDPARFSRELFSQYDIYCGIREREQFIKGREENLFDLAIWVDASQRLPPEDTSSCTVLKEDADIVIENNGTLDAFEQKVFRLCHAISIYSCLPFDPSKI